MKKSTTILILAISAIPVVVLLAGANKPEQGGREQIRVGVFDSRAVAIAYGNSDIFREILKEKKAQKEKADAAGDKKKAQELEKWGRESQDIAHKRAFGTASMDELLECIKDKIPTVAEKAKVDVIVSKWDIVYQADDIELINVTNLMAELYEPDERALEWIRQIQDQPPIPQEQLENIED